MSVIKHILLKMNSTMKKRFKSFMKFASGCEDRVYDFEDRLVNWLKVCVLVITILSAFVCAITLLWDSAVWLFNTNWRTSNFRIPLYSFISLWIFGALCFGGEE